MGFQLADLYLAFDPVAQPGGRGALSVWFHVPDARATFDRLIALGATAKEPPQDCGGEVIASVFDPEGNVVGLVSSA